MTCIQFEAFLHLDKSQHVPMAQAMTIGPKIRYFKIQKNRKIRKNINETYFKNESAVGMHHVNQSCIFL